MFSSGGGFGMGPSFGGGIGQFIGGLFGDSDQPYEDAMDQYRQWAKRGEDVQNPFLKAGTGAIGNYQDWLNGMKDPSGFINNLMGKYQESPWAKYMQQQAMRAGNNAASASGLIGSTPFAQQMQQNAAGISSQDMQNWLGQVLGINTQYGAGNQYLMGQGANAANQLTNMFNQMGGRMGEAAYGAGAGRNQDRNNLWGGLFNIGLGLAGM